MVRSSRPCAHRVRSFPRCLEVFHLSWTGKIGLAARLCIVMSEVSRGSCTLNGLEPLTLRSLHTCRSSTFLSSFALVLTGSASGRSVVKHKSLLPSHPCRLLEYKVVPCLFVSSSPATSSRPISSQSRLRAFWLPLYAAPCELARGKSCRIFLCFWDCADVRIVGGRWQGKPCSRYRLLRS